jgi:hypothetical protein
VSAVQTSRCREATPRQSPRLTQRRGAIKSSVDDFRQALDIIGDAGGGEAAIVAQFALDLAVTAQFRSDGGSMDAEEARRLLHMRIAHHRAAQHQASGTIH